jgi:myo-inositol 2-dehydrogenase/D-chiro-inositol 1-dehydrogenase
MTARFLLDTEVTAAQVLKPRQNSRASDHLTDPLLILLETASGALIDVEASINIQYGYDIRGVIVGEAGTVLLAESTPVVV